MPNAIQSFPDVKLHNEIMAADGSVLPSWQAITSVMDQLDATQVERRQIDIARQLRANGIAYSPLSESDAAPRPWNLDLYPMVIEPADWAALSAGLEQRARLKQAILSDIYGHQNLLRKGLIPPAMVFAHKGYLRDAVNCDDSQSLPLFSADVSRSPSGRWYVVDDICQFPEGIGYSLENRLVLSRTLPRLFRNSRVLRIAEYFKHLQSYIGHLSEYDGRCVMLAPGPTHPHYFEYAYLSKYLGYTLVQVGDLTIRDNRAYIKTVSGLQRVAVIFRFINDTELDPLAIGQAGVRGITGLFQAVRAGGVKVINPLGAGVMENAALNSCMTRLCRELLGEDLRLPGPPTYWLGDDKQRNHVLGKLDKLLFRSIDSLGQLHDPRLMTAAELDRLHMNIRRTPQRFVAQERIDRSCAPGFRGTERVQRQVTVRLYMVRHDDGQTSHYQTMPGGLCLLDTVSEGRRPPFNSLIGSKDTWVIADGPVKPVTLLGKRSLENQYVLNGELPSRVAENLFWMGRNAARCENSARLLRSVFQVLQNDDVDSSTVSPVLSAILRATTQATGTLPGFIGRGGARKLENPEKELLSLLHDPERVGTLPSALSALQNSASAVRDRVSDELLQILNRLEDRRTKLVQNVNTALFTEDTDALEQTSDQLDDILMLLSAFSGLTHENFTHGDGWRFMMLGRRLDRVAQYSVIIDTMLSQERDDTLLLETLLKLFDSTMTYRSRYRSQMDASLVLQLLMLDEYNPRSLAFQLNEIEKTIRRLPGRRNLSQADDLSRLVIAGLSRIQLADTDSLINAARGSRQNLGKFLSVLSKLPNEMADVLSATYFAHVESSQQLSDVSANRTSVRKAEPNNAGSAS
ncbi:circularly permuted type 2 ATP-grasp protein [Granulosicoccus sp. 3-233]|uniref:circularly permuted type 2 ATP-grasp protein n=1 Tax=Granulosicoccus sp. 3-233 TaxID=3417969 RepID=UPI003D33E3B4